MSDLIAQYAQHLEDTDRAESTIALYVWLLRRADTQLPAGLCAANAEELAVFLNTPHAYRSGRRSRATRQLYRTVLGGFFAWACGPHRPLGEGLDFDPADLLPSIRVLRAERPLVRDEELADILAQVDEPYRLWIWLACYAGLRCVEISRLDREHVDRHDLVVVGKGDRQRVVPTNEQLWKLLEPLPDGPVALTLRGRRANRQYVSRDGGRHIHRLGYPHLSMHDGRRWFGRNVYVATGFDIRATQELLGHASVATTQRYVGVAAAAKAAGVAGLPVLAAA